MKFSILALVLVAIAVAHASVMTVVVPEGGKMQMKTLYGPADVIPSAPNMIENAVSPLWSYEHPVSMYTSSLFGNDTDKIAAGLWLEAPFNVEVFDLNGKGTPAWTYTFDQTAPDWNDGIEVRVAVAKHQSSMKSAGPVSVVVGVYDGPGNFSGRLEGFSWTKAAPVWTFELTKIATDLADLATIAVSDDGSVVAALMFSGMSFEHPPYVELLVLNAQTGKQIWSYTVPSDIQPGISSLVLTPDGHYASFVSEETVIVLDIVNKALRGKPINMGFGPASNAFGICPMAHTLVYGFEEMYVYTFDTTTQDWTPAFTTNIPSHYVSAVTVGHGSIAVGWESLDATSFAVALYDEAVATPKWVYQSDPTTGQYQEYAAKVVMTADAIAVANWGAQNDTSPTILLFSMTSNVPLLTYTTPGSMFDIDLLTKNGKAWIVASGKLVHANEMGSGGQILSLTTSL